MRGRKKDGHSAVGRGLDIGYGVTLATAIVFGIVPAYAAGDIVPATVVVLLLTLATALWFGRRRAVEGRDRPEDVAWGWSLSIASSVALASFMPHIGPGVVLMVLVGVLVIGVDVGFAAGAVAGGAYSALLAAEITLVYDTTTGDIVAQSGGVGVVLLLVAAVGQLIRNVEAARAEAEAARGELAQANVQLRRALLVEGELVLARERARSARELHDGLGHSLTLVAMALQLAQRLRQRDEAAAWVEVDTAARTNAEALETMRRWVRALDPPGDAETLGGSDAFEAIADSFRGTGLDVRVQHRGEQEPLPADASLFATRFLQEGLTNVLRHAEANVVEIDVRQSPHQLRLAIGDDGKGADGDPEGFGRRSLRERAELLGGTVRAGRSPLGGVELTAVLPLTVGEEA